MFCIWVTHAAFCPAQQEMGNDNYFSERVCCRGGVSPPASQSGPQNSVLFANARQAQSVSQQRVCKTTVPDTEKELSTCWQKVNRCMDEAIIINAAIRLTVISLRPYMSTGNRPWGLAVLTCPGLAYGPASSSRDLWSVGRPGCYRASAGSGEGCWTRRVLSWWWWCWPGPAEANPCR